jgi:hypothetical protein
VKIINASQYPDGVVLRLIRYAFAGIPATGVGVFVRNCDGHAGRGLAYNGLPRERRATLRHCPYLPSDGVTRYVSLEMGGPERFPSTNVMPRITARRQVRLTDDVLFDEQGRPRTGKDAMAYLTGLLAVGERVRRVDKRGRYATVASYVDMPYGGRGSPLITYHDWQEGIVAYAAHEARHIWQFEQRARERARGRVMTRMSEAHAEQYAQRVLTCFRRHRAAVLAAPLSLDALPTVSGRMYTVPRFLRPPERLYGDR